MHIYICSYVYIPTHTQMNKTAFLGNVKTRILKGGFNLVSIEWDLYPVNCTGRVAGPNGICNITRVIYTRVCVCVCVCVCVHV